jgi:FkbM family methyltransferase
MEAFMDPIAEFHRHDYLELNRARLEHLESLALPIEGKSIVELGAGIGDLTPFLLSKSQRVTAIEGRSQDVTIMQGRYPREDYPGLQIVQMDVSAPRHLPEAPYDVVFCYGLLYHLQNPAAFLDWLKEITGGLLLLETRVSCGVGPGPHPVTEDRGIPSRALEESGCRPDREWLFDELRRRFQNVYLTRTQPDRWDFPKDWEDIRSQQSDGTALDTNPATGRTIYVASCEPLAIPTLSPKFFEKYEDTLGTLGSNDVCGNDAPLEQPSFDFVQIGANTGEDQFRDWVLANDPRGLMIEPVPAVFKTLKQNYARCSNLSFENIAIGTKTERRSFYYLKDTAGMPPYASEIGSFDREHPLAVARKNGFYDRALEEITSIDVPCLTFADLMAKYSIKRIDRLVIDAEGCDVDILNSIDHEEVEIGSIVFEYKHADGFKTVGKRYCDTVYRLQRNGFAVRRIDPENCEAKKVGRTPGVGVVFVVWGDFDAGVLRRSVDSLRAHHEFPICVISDADKPELAQCADQVIIHDRLDRELKAKDVIYDLSPFDVTLFLDCDTVILDDLSFAVRMAERHGLAVCIAPTSRLADYPLELPELTTPDAVVYNTGVILFRKSPKVAELFAEWRARNDSLDCRCDQPGFSLAVEKTEFNPYVLPRTWNFRPANRFGPLNVDGHGPIRIWHSYSPPPSDLSFTRSQMPWILPGSELGQ